MDVLLLIVVLAAGAYLADCWRWPYRPCRRCGGRTIQRARGRRVYRACRHHQERIRAGARLVRPGLRKGR